MGCLIDTNVLAELRRGARCNEAVARWFRGVASDDLFLSVMVIGEVRRGIEGVRRRDAPPADRLERWLGGIERDYAARILPITASIADRWGRLNVPDPAPVVDG